MNARLWAITVLLVGVGWFCSTPAGVAAPKHMAAAQAKSEPWYDAVLMTRAQAIPIYEGALKGNSADLQRLEQVAHMGNAPGEVLLGEYYAERKEYTIANDWYRKAALQGYSRAEFGLGVSYAFGQGVPRNYAKAVYWLRKAAMQGDAWGEVDLGIAYDRGHGVPRNYAKAAYWYHKAALQGNAWGETGLGLSYQESYGVPRNYAKAVYWFRKAAMQGDAGAEFNLGVSYQEGHGVPRDDIKAAYWYHKAALQGGAVGKLAQTYFRGLEKPKPAPTNQANQAYLECLRNQQWAILMGQPPATCIP